jgi:hypothetical protein
LTAKIFGRHSTHLLQIFAKYNKRYQNVNSKRLQLTTVYSEGQSWAIFDIILPTLVIRIPNLEFFLFCQHNSTGGGNLESRQTMFLSNFHLFSSYSVIKIFI